MQHVTQLRPMLAAALAYAARGWPVFPVGADKMPLISRAAGGQGFKDATTNPSQIREWWGKHPNAGIGIPTGTVSGIVVLDLDRKHGDPAAMLDSLAQAIGQDPPETATSLTGGGGRHLVFALGSHTVRSSAGALSPGVDVRGEGGYIVAPPSAHKSGTPYQWAEADPDCDYLPGVEPAPADWLVRIIARLHPASAQPAQPARERQSDLGDTSWVPSALAAISPDCRYDEWYRIGMALEQLPDGFALFDKWSSGGATYPGSDEVGRAWNGWAGKTRNIGLGTLWQRATEAGWKPPARESAPPPTDEDAPAWLTGRRHDAPRSVDDSQPFDLGDVPPPELYPPVQTGPSWEVHVADVTQFLLSAVGNEAAATAAALEAGAIPAALAELAQRAPGKFEALALTADTTLGAKSARALVREAKRIAKERTALSPQSRPRQQSTALVTTTPTGAACVFGPYHVANIDGVTWLVKTRTSTEGAELPPERVCSPPVTVDGLVRNVTDGVESVRLSWVAHGQPRDATIPRSAALSSRNLSPYFDLGLPGSSNSAAALVGYIEEAIARLPTGATLHTRVCGWHTGPDGRHVYVRGPVTHGADEPVYMPPPNAETRTRHAVERGILADWSRAIAPALAKYPALRVCVAAAAASPFLAVLGPTARPFVVDLCGDSGCGKTQMMEAALSVIGAPQELHTSYADTVVGIETHLESFCDVTVGIDETKRFTGPPQALSQFVYHMMGGHGKGRGTPSPGRLRRTAVFRSVVLSTSEYPLSSVTGDGGLRSRCVTLQGWPWLERSPARAEEIAQLLDVLGQHHGGPLRAVVDHLVAMTEADRVALRERWRQQVRYYRGLADATHREVEIRTRLAEYMATLAVAGEALAYTTGCAPVDMYWVDQATWSQILDCGRTADRATAALELLIAQPATDPARWWTPSAPAADAPTLGWMGRWSASASDAASTGRGISDLAILPDRCDDLLRRHDYSPEAVYAAWHQRGWLVPEGRHRARKVSLAGTRTRAYVLSPEALAIAQGAPSLTADDYDDPLVGSAPW